jgi:hypothetical protein
MRRPLVRPLQQRREVLFKNVVILLASKQPMLAELSPGDLALVAGGAHFFLKAGMRHHKVGEQLIDGSVSLDRRRNALALCGALLAQMLLDLLAVADLGEMDRRLFVAVIAFQSRTLRW